MITAHRSIDTVLQREMKFASPFGWKIPWCSHCFISEIIVFILIIRLSLHCCIHWKSREMKASLTYPKRSLNAMRLGTIGSVMPSIFLSILLLWSGRESKRSSRTQKAFPERSCREKMTTCVQLSRTAAGLWSDTLGGCRLQVGGCDTTPEVAPSIGLWQRCEPW